ncbi:unnamed protein product [Cunninghamella blakesleeana]
MKFSIIYVTILFFIGYINSAVIYLNDKSMDITVNKRSDRFDSFESSLSYIYEKRDSNEDEKGPPSEKVHGFGDNSDDDEHTED